MFSIITCGDSKYFEFLKNFESNIFQIYKFYPVIYDLGLTPDQAKELKSEILCIKTDNKFFKKNPKNCIYSTHKPYCIIHFLNTQKNDCFYIDADTISTSKISTDFFQNIDIAITPRHKKEHRQSHLKNGLLNAGVLYFKNSDKVKKLIHEWLQACIDTDSSDQEALSLLLSKEVDLLQGSAVQKYKDLDIALLDPAEYNDVSCSTGRIFHFKNAARKNESWIKYINTVYIQKKHPIYTHIKTSLFRSITQTISALIQNKKNYYRKK